MRTALVILIPALLAGCDAPAPGNKASEASQPRPIARTVVETEESAQFRLAARQLYVELEEPACGKLGRRARKAQLAPERAAVKAFEERLGTTGAAFQLAVARADARYRQGCRSDGAIDHARQQVASRLAALGEMLPRLDQVPVQEPIPARSAAYRDLVRKLVASVQPLCRLVSGGSDTGILAPALDAVRQYQASLPNALYRHHYAIAKADVDLEQSMTMVECAAPWAGSPDKMRDELLVNVRRQIAALQAIRL